MARWKKHDSACGSTDESTDVATHRDPGNRDRDEEIQEKRHAETRLKWINALLLHADGGETHQPEHGTRCTTRQRPW